MCSTPVVARDHDHANALCAQGCQGLGCAGFGLVGKCHQGAQSKPCPVRSAMAETVAPSACNARWPWPSLAANQHAQLFHPAQAADVQVAARIHLALGATPWHGLQLLRYDDGDALLLAAQRPLRHGPGDVRCHSAGWRPHRSPRLPQRVPCWHLLEGTRIQRTRNQQRAQAWPPHSQRAGFVKRHGVHLVRHLQRLGVLDQDAVLRATPVPAMMAAGVASPRAQGQAITSTATAWITPSQTGGPVKNQPSSGQ
jgi:hypothetical protein